MQVKDGGQCDSPGVNGGEAIGGDASAYAVDFELGRGDIKHSHGQRLLLPEATLWG